MTGRHTSPLLSATIVSAEGSAASSRSPVGTAEIQKEIIARSLGASRP